MAKSREKTRWAAGVLGLACVVLAGRSYTLAGSVPDGSYPSLAVLLVSITLMLGTLALLLSTARFLFPSPEGEASQRNANVFTGPDGRPVPWRLAGRDLPRSLAVLLLIGLCFGLVWLIAQSAMPAFGGVLDTGVAVDNHEDSRTPAWRMLAVLFCLAVAYQEELLYRFWFPAVLARPAEPAGPDIAPIRQSNRSEVFVAYVAVSLLFASGHVYQSWSGFLFALCMGLSLSLLAYRGWSWHSLAIGHALWNLVVLQV